MSSLNGRAVIVTGAAQGLGAAYATAIIRQGGRVLLNDADTDRLAERVAALRAEGGDVHGSVGDVAEFGYAETLVADCVSHFGQLDGLINNAGVQRRGLPWETDAKSVELMVRVNVLGSILVGAAALTHMRDAGRGVVLNITSGTLLGRRTNSVYSATKASIPSLTKSWAKDMEGTGVRVTAFSPLAATPLTERSMEYAQRHGGNDAAWNSQDDLPSAEVMADAVVFLLSDAAAALNGAVIRFDGHDLSLLEMGFTSIGHQEKWDTASLEAALVATTDRS